MALWYHYSVTHGWLCDLFMSSDIRTWFPVDWDLLSSRSSQFQRKHRQSKTHTYQVANNQQKWWGGKGGCHTYFHTEKVHRQTFDTVLLRVIDTANQMPKGICPQYLLTGNLTVSDHGDYIISNQHQSLWNTFPNPSLLVTMTTFYFSNLSK